MENQYKSEGPKGILFFNDNSIEKQEYKPIITSNNSNVYFDAIISILNIFVVIYCIYILIKYA